MDRIKLTPAEMETLGLDASMLTEANLMGTVGNTFELFDVSLTEGATAPPFAVPDYASELALCQRYYHKQNAYLMGYAAAGSSTGQFFNYPVRMRANPTVAPFTGGAYSNASAGSPSGGNDMGFRAVLSPTVTGMGYYDNFTFVANARL